MTDKSWVVVHSVEFEAWFKEISDEEAAAVAADVIVLQTFGPQLGRPYVDTLEGSGHKNMKELRTGTIRTAFAFDPLRRAILLCAGDKAGLSSRTFYKRLVKKADRIYGEHLKAVEAEQAEAEEER